MSVSNGAPASPQGAATPPFCLQGSRGARIAGWDCAPSAAAAPHPPPTILPATMGGCKRHPAPARRRPSSPSRLCRAPTPHGGILPRPHRSRSDAVEDTRSSAAHRACATDRPPARWRRCPARLLKASR